MIKKQDQISSLEIKQLQLEQEIDDNSLLNISQSLQSKLVQEQDLINIIDRLVVENQSIRNNEFVYNDKIIKDSLLEQLFESDNDVQIAMLQLSDKECQLQSMKKVDQEQTIIIKYLIEQQQTIDDDTSVYLKSQQDKQYAILETKYKNKITKLQNIIIQQQTIQ
ncbi:hypothetical protein SS50377_24126 [Spironucleus salmonicida]|uniref:Uncharacterized protein n=1 Tax=Spironucleus salmonicida TaxID=348837 RepID=V6LHP4_9EUKA|nr:hypothetical protein SS50377_24126 [Spironucleus salmonicida]|eukprot:EST44095.1 Hypothetical protein SS50377_16094 [Spironucleus salmonicida]